MKRRTLDLIFAVGGLLIALLILVLGLVLQNQAELRQELRARSTRPAEDLLHSCQVPGGRREQPVPEEVRREAADHGSEAACYANHYIGVHVTQINDGKTYAETSNDALALDSQARGDARPEQRRGQGIWPPQVAVLHGKATTLFQGETLRGLLLTSYGFSIFGDRAQQAAHVCFALALVLFLAAIAGFVHAATKSAEQPILAHPA